MNFSLSRREAALVLVTALWGGTFLAVQVALQWASPFALVGVRFGLAATLLGAVLWWRGELRGLNRFELRAGLMLGVWVYLGFGLQTAGLLHIDSSQSAFLTALYVPLVPLVLWLWKRQLPTAWAWLAIGMAVAGTYALTGAHTNLASMNIGDWLTVACALAFAMEIVLLGHYSQRCQPVRLAWVITLTVAVLIRLPEALAATCAWKVTVTLPPEGIVTEPVSPVSVALKVAVLAPALASLRALPEVHEAVLLSTCNRTELTAHADGDERA